MPPENSVSATPSSSRRLRPSCPPPSRFASTLGSPSRWNACKITRPARDSARLVRHFSEAEALVGSEKLIKYLMLAGEQALSTYAYEEALEYFRRALAAKGESGPDDQLAAILFGLGRAQVATAQRHEMQDAVETLTRAFDYYEKAGDVETALQVAVYPVMATTGITGIMHLISRALDLAGPGLPPFGQALGKVYPGRRA